VLLVADTFERMEIFRKLIPGTGRAKHPGEALLVDSRTDLPDALPYSSSIFPGNLLKTEPTVDTLLN